MLGTRGVRLGVVKPGLYAMQVRALMEAAGRAGRRGRQAGGRDHDPAHRHPRGDGPGPVAGSRRRSTEADQGRQGKRDQGDDRHDDRDARGPRSGPTRSPRRPTSSRFGTNDLTQMTFGFSRDDVEARMMPRLPRAGPAEAQPVRDDRRRAASASSCAWRRAGPRRPSPTSSSACAASTAATPSRSPCSTTAGLDYVSLLAVPGADRPAGRGPGRLGRRVGTTPVDTEPPVLAALSAQSPSAGARRRGELRQLRLASTSTSVAVGRVPRRSSTPLLLVDLLLVHRRRRT